MGGIEQAIVLTYETLYEILRKEKSRDDLQKLEEAFLANVLNYLREKQTNYDDTLTKNDIFNQTEREQLGTQLTNIKKIIKDLYDIRERKIITMAINKSRTKTNIIDTTTLLPEEQHLYNTIVDILSTNRAAILHHLIELRQPTVLLTPQPKIPLTIPEPMTNTKKVTFLEPITEFAGEDLELYGPYQANDNAEIPKEVADLLISQGKALEN